MKINKKSLTNGVVIFALILLASGGLMAVNAAKADTAKNGRAGMFQGEKFANLTTEQQAEIQAKRAEQEKLREARQATVQAALDKGDYQAWLTAVGTTNPLAQKITAENFPKFVEAHKLRQQADKIMADLGLNGLGLMGQGQPGNGRHGEMRVDF